MATKSRFRRPRASYCPEDVRRANVQLDDRLRRLYKMDLKAYKALKNGLLSIGLLVFAGFLVVEGADPTLVGTGTLALLALLNGIELAEFYSAWEEVRTAQARDHSDTDQHAGTDNDS